MNTYNQFLQIVVLLSCLYASYTDLRYKKIPNPLTFGLLVLGVFNHALYSWIGEVPLAQTLAILLGSGVISFFLYFVGIWSPGDAKLYWGLCAILPPDLLAELGGGADTTPVTLGINIFALYFAFVLPYLFIKTTWRQKVQALTEIFHPTALVRVVPEMLFTIPVFLGLSRGVSFLMDRLWFGSTVVTRLFLIILLFSIINRLIAKHRLKKPLTYIFIALGFVATLIVPGATTPFLMMLAGFLSVYILFRPFILRLGHFALTQTISVFDLKEGMIPGERIFHSQIGEKSAVSKIPAYFASPLGREVIVDVNPRGLTQAEIDELQQMAEAGLLQGCENQIAVQRPISFALLIAGGALLTMICKAPFYTYFIVRFLYPR